MPKREQRALVVAAIAALLAIVATYAFLRAYDVLFATEPNPATVIWSARIAVFWRVGVGAYAAGLVAPLAFVAARADVNRAARALVTAATIVAVAIGAQGLLLP